MQISRTVTVVTTIFLAFISQNMMADVMQPVGELKTGNCNNLPGFSDVVDQYGGAVGCAGGSVFKQGPPFVAVDFHYEGQYLAAYDGTDALPPEANGLVANVFKGFGKIGFSQEQIDLTIKSQVDMDIPLSISFGDFGADGAFKIVGYVDDDTLPDEEPITLQMDIKYSVSAKCDINLNCGMGSFFQLVEKPLEAGGGSLLVADSKILSLGPNEDDFFPSTNLELFTQCLYNESTQQNECDVDVDEIEFIQLKNRVPYGISIGAYTFGGGPEGHSLNVDNSNTWSMAVTTTEANPDAVFVLVPEPSAFTLTFIAALAAFRRNHQ